MGTGYSRLTLNYDARSKLHVAPQSFGSRRVAERRGVDVYAEAGNRPSFPAIRNESMLSPSALDYEPDLSSH